jgi:hypothetical protein
MPKGLQFKFMQDLPEPTPAREPPSPHVCVAPGCRKTAHFGFGVRTRLGQPGRWYCGLHKSQGDDHGIRA